MSLGQIPIPIETSGQVQITRDLGDVSTDIAVSGQVLHFDGTVYQPTTIPTLYSGDGILDSSRQVGLAGRSLTFNGTNQASEDVAFNGVDIFSFDTRQFNLIGRDGAQSIIRSPGNLALDSSTIALTQIPGAPSGDYSVLVRNDSSGTMQAVDPATLGSSLRVRDESGTVNDLNVVDMIFPDGTVSNPTAGQILVEVINENLYNIDGVISAEDRRCTIVNGSLTFAGSLSADFAVDIGGSILLRSSVGPITVDADPDKLILSQAPIDAPPGNVNRFLTRNSSTGIVQLDDVIHPPTATAMNLGAGVGAYAAKSADELQFKSFVSNNGTVTFADTVDEINCEATNLYGSDGSLAGNRNVDLNNNDLLITDDASGLAGNITFANHNQFTALGSMFAITGNSSVSQSSISAPYRLVFNSNQYLFATLPGIDDTVTYALGMDGSGTLVRMDKNNFPDGGTGGSDLRVRTLDSLVNVLPVTEIAVNSDRLVNNGSGSVTMDFGDKVEVTGGGPGYITGFRSGDDYFINHSSINTDDVVGGTFSPGPSLYWGTNASNQKGFFPINSGVGSTIRVSEPDGTPDITDVSHIRFTDGTVTDDGAGRVTINIPAPGGGEVNTLASLGATTSLIGVPDKTGFALNLRSIGSDNGSVAISTTDTQIDLDAGDEVTLSGQTYLTLAGQEITANIIGTQHLTGGVTTPGNSEYYGSDASGTIGFWSLPSGTGDPDINIYDDNGTISTQRIATIADGGSLAFNGPSGSTSFNVVVTQALGLRSSGDDITIDAQTVRLIQTPPTDNADDSFLVRDALTQEIRIRDASTIVGTDTNIYNNDGVIPTGTNRQVTLNGSAALTVVGTGGSQSFGVNVVGQILLQSDTSIRLTSAGEVYISNAPPTDNTNDNLMAWDATTGRIELRSAASIEGGSGGGEINTASNVGIGSGWYKQKSGVNLEFKTITSTGGITVTPGVNEINVHSDAGVSLYSDNGTIDSTRTVTVSNDLTFNGSGSSALLAITMDDDINIISESSLSLGGASVFLTKVPQVNQNNVDVLTRNSTTGRVETRTISAAGNIYTADDTLQSNRTVTFGGNFLNFAGTFSPGDTFDVQGLAAFEVSDVHRFKLCSPNGSTELNEIDTGSNILRITSTSLQFGSLPFLNNAGTDILVRNATTGAIERRDAATFGGSMTASNLGTGAEVFKAIVSSNIQHRTLRTQTGSVLTIAEDVDGNHIDIDHDLSGASPGTVLEADVTFNDTGHITSAVRKDPDQPTLSANTTIGVGNQSTFDRSTILGDSVTPFTITFDNTVTRPFRTHVFNSNSGAVTVALPIDNHVTGLPVPITLTEDMAVELWTTNDQGVTNWQGRVYGLQSSGLTPGRFRGTLVVDELPHDAQSVGDIIETPSGSNDGFASIEIGDYWIIGDDKTPGDALEVPGLGMMVVGDTITAKIQSPASASHYRRTWTTKRLQRQDVNTAALGSSVDITSAAGRKNTHQKWLNIDISQSTQTWTFPETMSATQSGLKFKFSMRQSSQPLIVDPGLTFVDLVINGTLRLDPLADPFTLEPGMGGTVDFVDSTGAGVVDTCVIDLSWPAIPPPA